MLTMLLYVNDVKSNDLTITAKVAESTLIVKLTGTADGTVVGLLSDYLTRTMKELLGRAFTILEFDFSNLYILNSSCIKLFANLVFELSTSKSVLRVCFAVSSTLSWQTNALVPLERLVPGFVMIEKR